MNAYIADERRLKADGTKAGNYVLSKAGATDRILKAVGL